MEETNNKNNVIFNLEDNVLWEEFCEMQALREENEYCDVKLKVGDDIFSAHRIVLAAASPYFRTILKSKCEEITIHGIESSTFHCILSFIYTKTIEINAQNVKNLFIGSSILLLKQLHDACVEFLVTSLSPNNVFDIKQLENSINSTILKSAVESYIRCEFSKVFLSKEFLMLDLNEVIQIIKEDELNVDSEETIFEACITWIKFKINDRKILFPEILKHVRLHLLSPEYFYTRVAKEALVESSKRCRDLLNEAYSFHLLPNYRFEMKELRTRRNFKKNIGNIYVLGGESSTGALKSIEIYDPVLKKWKAGKNLPIAMSNLSASVLDSKLYTFGGFDGLCGNSYILYYDRTEEVWTHEQNLSEEKYKSAASVFNDCAYICGGKNSNSLKTVECYDPRNNDWSELSPLTEERDSFCVLTFNGSLYAIGGLINGTASKTVEKYDFKKMVWLPAKSLLTERSDFGAAVLNNKIYVCGGRDENDETLKSVEVYDPSTDEWKEVSPMNCKRYAFSIVAYNEMLWAIGGADENNQYMSSVEVYNPNNDEWSFVQDLNENKSDFGVAVLLD